MAAAEDPMELSSEMNPPTNAEDIDIDLVTSDLPQEGEDDFMAEDITSVADQELPDVDAPQTGNDDVMFDDEYPSREFQENFSVHDEDLEDAEESAIDDGANTTSVSLEENVEDQSVPQEEGADVAHASAKAPESNLQDLKDMQRPASIPKLAEDQSHSNADSQLTSLHDTNIPADLEGTPVAPDNGNHNAEGTYDHEPANLAGITNAQEDEEEPSQIPRVTLDVNTNQHESLATNADFSQVSPHVHPIVVLYQDHEMYLFPPIDQDQEQSQTYFLEDEAYAAASINDLLGACRSVLGDSINEQYELEIQIGELDLHISEFAPESSTTTLAEILDLYVQLQRHDGIDSPGPLYIALCTKIRFSHRMNYLINAVAEGKGFSQLSLLEPPDEDHPQSEYSEKQDAVGKDDLQDTDISTYAEIEDSQPVNVETGNGKKAENEVEINRKTAGNTPNDLEGHACTTETPNVNPPDGNTSVEDEGQSNQLSSRRGDVYFSNEASPNGEQNMISKVEEESNVSSPVGVSKDAIARSEDTTAEEENLINYEDEDGEGDVNHAFSTRSSTIQGDSIETSKFDLTSSTDNVLDDELAESVNEQLKEDHDQQELTGQAHIPDCAAGVYGMEEVEAGTCNGNFEVDDGELLEFEQEGEDFELEPDQGDEYGHEQVDSSSPDQETVPDFQDEGIYDENLPIKQRQTEVVSVYKPTEGYKDPHNQEEDTKDHDYSNKNHKNPQVGTEDDETHENTFGITLDHEDSGQNTETSKVNGTLSPGYEHDSDYSRSIPAPHMTADQESHEKRVSDLDEINYEEEEDADLSTIPATQSANASPGSLKRMRSDQDDGPLDDHLQDLKRIRSS